MPRLPRCAWKPTPRKTKTVTSIVAPIMASICTCCTSLVLRVMSEPAPKAEISRSEKPLTRSLIRTRLAGLTRRNMERTLERLEAAVADR